MAQKPSLVQIALGLRSGSIKRKDLPEKVLAKAEKLNQDLQMGGKDLPGRARTITPEHMHTFRPVRTRAVRS